VSQHQARSSPLSTINFPYDYDSVTTGQVVGIKYDQLIVTLLYREQGNTSRKPSIERGSTSRKPSIERGSTSRKSSIERGSTSRKSSIERGNTSISRPLSRRGKSVKPSTKRGKQVKQVLFSRGNSVHSRIPLPSKSIRSTGKRHNIEQNTTPESRAYSKRLYNLVNPDLPEQPELAPEPKRPTPEEATGTGRAAPATLTIEEREVYKLLQSDYQLALQSWRI